MSPDAIRRTNFVQPSAMPYTSATKLLLDSGEFEEVMDRCMAAAEWSSFPKRRARSERNDKLRGIGMATYTERCGGGFPETASIEFKDERIELVMGNQEYGTGLVTAYKQLVSDQLGVDPDRVDVIMGDTDRTPSGLTGGSRALAVAGVALYEAGRTIIDKGTQLAAHLLEVSAHDVRFADGVFSVPGTDLRLDIFAVAKAARDPAKLPAGMEPGLDTTHHRVPPAQTFPNGCHIVEVEIEPDTGVVTIERYTVVDDFGRTINPLLLEGQVHGGIVQGIGQALLEHAIYDPDSGQLLSGSFMDYAASGHQRYRRRSPRSRWIAPHRYASDAEPCMGNAQWNLNTSTVIRTLDWTYVTALPIGAKQATGGRKLAAGGFEPLFSP
jgi:carbon-monoxide dehydrogenase large subunit